MVLEARHTLQTLTDDYEISVTDDGSCDGSRDLLIKLQHNVPQLRLIFHEKNLGYGGARQSGFSAAKKDLVFYTDGNAQYDFQRLAKTLVQLFWLWLQLIVWRKENQ